MTSDVYVVKCAKCGRELEYNCTYGDDGNLCILVELCDDCATDTYNEGYEEGHEDGYNEGYEEGYVDGCIETTNDKENHNG